uniref:Uncharacterized protein n=1 Tax=Scleropages formosus TaxID=113540 RepID=A0A8C9SB45_SCLFO
MMDLYTKLLAVIHNFVPQDNFRFISSGLRFLNKGTAAGVGFKPGSFQQKGDGFNHSAAWCPYLGWWMQV